ncbi:MAG: ABC transporter substrate-binding protein [Oscillospiraceae bacterium]|nr:ABC transporter substrate-binding protein [Oscillospiraceae bacterium]
MKKMKTIVSSVLAVIMVLTLLAGCGSASEPAPEQTSEPVAENTSITVTDMAGREVVLEKAAEKIVALEPSDCEILYYLDALDRLVGRGEYCDFPAEVMDVPSVQSGYETNIEEVIALEPEVVIMTRMAQTEDQVNALEKAGIKVIMTDAQDIEGVYTAIELIGKVVGRETEAQNTIDYMKSEFDAIKATALDEEKTIYFEVSPLEWGLWTAGNHTFMNEIAEMMGCKNAFADAEGWAEVSEEQVIAADPDYIVTITMYFGEGQTPEEEIAARPGWENIKAVVNGNIIDIQDNSLSRPSPRLVDGARALYGLVVNPEQLENAA